MQKQWTKVMLAILFTCLFALNSEATEQNQDGRFIKANDNTIIDTQTGLMWATDDNGVDTNWEDAKAFCENYSAGGHDDWRLPTIKELRTIYESTSDKQFKAVAPINLSACCPWSADTRRKRARAVFFMGGEVNTFSKKLATGFRALPVRNAR